MLTAFKVSSRNQIHKKAATVAGCRQNLFDLVVIQGVFNVHGLIHPALVELFHQVQDGQADDHDPDEEQDAGWIVDHFADQDEEPADNCQNRDPRVQRRREGTGVGVIALAEDKDAKEGQGVEAVDGKDA